MAAQLTVLASQFTKIPYPTHLFTNKTVIVTGSNHGIGLEAARHFVRLDAAKVILAVRNVSKGLLAKSDIDATEKRGPNVVEVWEVNLSSYDSVKKFAARAQALERLDVFVSNAGFWTEEFVLVEEDETHVTINVIDTLLLALMVLPKMRETSVAFNTQVVSTFVGSFTHTFTNMPERKATKILEELNNEKGARMTDRYNVSKLMLLFAIRALANDLDNSSKEGDVVFNIVNPGLVDTGIWSNLGLFKRMVYLPLKPLHSTTEVGARNLIHSAVGGKETQGMYLSGCKVAQPSSFVTSDDGIETQKRLWIELREKLERIQPGVLQNI